MLLLYSYREVIVIDRLCCVIFQDEVLDRSVMLGSPNDKVNLYESLRHSGAATILENLQSQLKQREGEIVQLQVKSTSPHKITGAWYE